MLRITKLQAVFAITLSSTQEKGFIYQTASLSVNKIGMVGNGEICYIVIIVKEN